MSMRLWLAAALAGCLPAFGALADGPAPARLLHAIDLSSFAPAGAYHRSTLQFGDLDNDGSPRDILRSVNGVRLQALAHDGAGNVRVLWSHETGITLPPPPNRYFWKALIWDLDGDGKSEVVYPLATADGIDLAVLDGATGAVKTRTALPLKHPKDDHPNKALRIKVTVANLSGGPRPSDLVVLSEEDSRGDIWAFDKALKPLWDTTGDNGEKRRIYAHYPWARDLDGDGREELVGNWMIGPDGKRGARLTPAEWAAKDLYYDHIDRAFVGDFVPGRPGLEVIYSHEFLFAAMAGADGTILWSKPGTNRDAKTVAVGEFDNANAGLEIVVEDPDAKVMRLLDLTGKELRTLPAVPAGYPMDWDGDRSQDELFEARRGTIVNMTTGKVLALDKLFEKHARTPTPEAMRLYGHAVDLVGDSREEVVLADEDELMIFGADGTGPAARPSPWTSPAYARAIANMMNDNHPERDAWLDMRTLPK
jgi:hypothetical protein